MATEIKTVLNVLVRAGLYSLPVRKGNSFTCTDNIIFSYIQHLVSEPLYSMEMSEVGNISGNITVTELPFASALGVQGYTAMVTVLLVLLVPPQLFLTIITIAGLCAGKEFRKIKAQRNIMIGIGATGFTSSMIVIMFAIADYLFLHHHKEAGVVFCHGATLFYHINAGMRNILLASLSVTVFITIKHGHQKIKVTYLNIALVVMLGIVLLLGIVYFFPSAVDYSFQFDGVLCVANLRPGGCAGIGITVALVDIPPRIISIAVVIASLVFVKKHSSTLTGENRLRRAMVKFTVLLVILNIVVFVANYGALISFFILDTFHDQLVLDFTGLAILRQLIDFILPSVPAVITPLMMMAVFKPLRAAIKTLLSSCCCGDTDGEKESHLTSTNTPGTSSTQDM